MPLIIDAIGWRWTFVANALIGVAWGAVWWFWYRDSSADHRSVGPEELELIQRGIEEDAAPDNSAIPYIQVVTSANVLLAMFQYAANNITFFISITWLQPYIIKMWGDEYRHLAAVEAGVAVICQKPLAPTLQAATQLVQSATRANVPLMVHENFRFQPWHSH